MSDDELTVAPYQRELLERLQQDDVRIVILPRRPWSNEQLQVAREIYGLLSEAWGRPQVATFEGMTVHTEEAEPVQESAVKKPWHREGWRSKKGRGRCR